MDETKSEGSFSVLTWNVWFASIHQKQRATGLFREIEQRNPSVVCLQEVTAIFLKLLNEDEYITSHYVLEKTGAQACRIGYGCVLLYRKDVKKPSKTVIVKLPTKLNRWLLESRFKFHNRTVIIGTVHLDSMKGMKETRKQQLELIFKRWKKHKHALLMGDFNFCSTWPEENNTIEQCYTDVWPALHDVKKEPGWTG